MIKDIFAVIGVITTLSVVVTFGYTAFECIVDRVRKRKYHYEVKHRFDKPPTAAKDTNHRKDFVMVDVANLALGMWQIIGSVGMLHQRKRQVNRNERYLPNNRT